MTPGFMLCLCFMDKQNILHIECKDHFFVDTELFLKIDRGSKFLLNCVCYWILPWFANK